MKRPDKTIPATLEGTYINLDKWMSLNWEKYAKDLEQYIDSKEKKIKDVIEVYDNYIKLLNKEIEGLVGLEKPHGWSSVLYQEGVVCRQKIEEAVSNYGR